MPWSISILCTKERMNGLRQWHHFFIVWSLQVPCGAMITQKCQPVGWTQNMTGVDLLAKSSSRYAGREREQNKSTFFGKNSWGIFQILSFAIDHFAAGGNKRGIKPGFNAHIKVYQWRSCFQIVSGTQQCPVIYFFIAEDFFLFRLWKKSQAFCFFKTSDKYIFLKIN